MIEHVFETAAPGASAARAGTPGSPPGGAPRRERAGSADRPAGRPGVPPPGERGWDHGASCLAARPLPARLPAVSGVATASGRARVVHRATPRRPARRDALGLPRGARRPRSTTSAPRGSPRCSPTSSARGCGCSRRGGPPGCCSTRCSGLDFVPSSERTTSCPGRAYYVRRAPSQDFLAAIPEPSVRTRNARGANLKFRREATPASPQIVHSRPRIRRRVEDLWRPAACVPERAPVAPRLGWFRMPASTREVGTGERARAHRGTRRPQVPDPHQSRRRWRRRSGPSSSRRSRAPAGTSAPTSVSSS